MKNNSRLVNVLINYNVIKVLKKFRKLFNDMNDNKKSNIEVLIMKIMQEYWVKYLINFKIYTKRNCCKDI